MDGSWVTRSRKRKRRRGQERPPVGAQLVLDTRLRGDVGVLSEDLFADLFPGVASLHNEHTPQKRQQLYYVAVSHNASSLLPQAVTSLPWTILPVKISEQAQENSQTPKSTLRFPASSNALHGFVHHLQKTTTNIARLALQSSIDILILDVVPLPLNTVVVSVDEDALAKLEIANQRFRKGHPLNGSPVSPTFSNLPHQQKRRQRSGSISGSGIPDDKWESAIRAALATQPIIHSQDLLPLPLASHPITHVPPPPAVVELCEPISQGFIVPQTRVVIVASRTQRALSKQAAPVPSYPLRNGTLVEEDEEDTSNEQFYSAAEDPTKSPAARKSSDVGSGSDAEDLATSNDEETDLSDGEADTLGLSLPSLPSQPSGTFSAFTSATPRINNPFLDGIASPGSVVSGFSMSTVLGGGSRGKLFEAQGLLSHIPNELLHPKPTPEDDEEARAFVDTALLAKIGCFAGDWVRLEAAADESLSTIGSWGFNAFDGAEEELPEWRIARIYALPGQSTKRPKYALNRSASHRHSRSFMLVDKSAPRVHLSPITLANLGNPPNIRIAKLDVLPARRLSRLSMTTGSINAPRPPTATDVTLEKFSTPIAHERSLDSSLKLALERYFKQRQRLVKNGDLIGIPINETLGRALQHGSAGDDEATGRELLSYSESMSVLQTGREKNSVAWFKVGAVHSEPQDVDSPWGPVVVVKPEVTKLSQAGDFHGKLPEVSRNSWQYYLGTKRLPPSPEASPDAGEVPLVKPKLYVSQMRRRLRELVSAAASPQAIHLSLPPLVILIVSTQRHIGKLTVAMDACADLGLHAFPIDCYEIVSEGGAGGGDVKTAGFLEARAERGLLSRAEYTTLILQHLDILTADRMIAAVRDIIAKSRILIATTTNVDKVPEGMRSLFTHELEMSAPDEGDREGILRAIIQDLALPLSADVDLSSVAVKTAALVAGDLADVVDRAAIARFERLEKLAHDSNQRLGDDDLRATMRDVQVAGGDASHKITKADFDVAVEAARKNFADSIGAPKIPNVSWDDVGGLTNVKDAVMETIQLPLERPELFAKGMKKRSGILFYGPPGTGKTLLAKAIATEFSLNFFSVKGPELLNMYIGESEANVRRVFQRARDARPCVVFFDELDSVAPKRGNQGDSGGVMDRIVSQLLAELDGMSNGEEGGGGVFVIGATNRPDLLDQALLRPGRFDKMLYLGVSDTHEKQQTILEALTRKFALSPTLSMAKVAASLPFTYTGADLYALCSDAMLKAITRKATAVDTKVRSINAKRASERPATSLDDDDGYSKPRSKAPISVAYFFDHFATPEDTAVLVEEGDFVDAHKELVPSVSAKELEHYQRVRQVFEMVEQGKKKEEKRTMAQGTQNGEDDLVARASGLNIKDGARLNMNGAPKSDKGKGKAKMQDTAAFDFGFGNAASGDEEALYHQ